jgi:magnesium chelatase family protein
MYSKALSCACLGVEGTLISVETDINDGLPMITMVGYLSSCVKESSERVRTALRNSNFNLPPKRITISLSPADIKKEGSAFDLPIAIGILTAMGEIPQDYIDNKLIIGELGLDGRVNPVEGVLAMVHHAFLQNITCCIVPSANAREAAIIEEMKVIPVESLRQTVDYLNGGEDICPEVVDVQALLRESVTEAGDFSEVKGHETLKRGIMIAAAGMHNILMTGPAGAGKSMIAKRIPTVLPQLTLKESIEITKIYSVAGLLKEGSSVIGSRPYRAPHHTISLHALSGGGREPRPGEISLAHGGVLFLDELPEFNRNVLEVMRQPLEDGEVTISRLGGVYRFPADFMLVAARNPCPCGQYPDLNKCTCTVNQIRNYNSRISKPLLDRVDINVEVRRVEYGELFTDRVGLSSADMRREVLKAQRLQQKRYEDEKVNFNSQLDTRLCDKYVSLGKNEKEFMEYAFNQMDMSARGSFRVLKIARTIADLEESGQVREEHLKEAIFFKNSENSRM